MNPIPLALSTSARTRADRPSKLWLVAGTTLLAVTAAARGDEPTTAPPPRPTLKLVDGGVVPGALADSDRPETLRWKADSFETPWNFAWAEVRSIRFPSEAKAPLAVGAFGFELTGGDLVFGSIANMDDKGVEIDVPRLRRLRVDRGRVRRIFRWQSGSGVDYNGPNGLGGWRQFEAPKLQPKRGARVAVANAFVDDGDAREANPKPNSTPVGPGWVEDGGALETTREKATIQGDVGLPSRSRVELEISWKSKPNFSVALGVSDDERSVDRAFRLEVWDGKLVALRETDKEADLASIQPIADGPGRARLQLFLDQELGKLLAFSETGEPLADLKLADPTGPSLPSIRLTNLRGDLRLERLRVGRWDGETPRPLLGRESKVRLTDRSNIDGQVDRFDPSTRAFVVRGDSGSTTNVAEDRVEAIHLSSPEDDALPAVEVQVAYADGTRLGGRWVGVEAGRMILAVPGVVGPVSLPQEGLRSIDVATASEEKPRAKEEAVGTLDMDGIRVMGRLVSNGPVGEKGLLWRPLAGDVASAIQPGASGRIVYQSPAPKPKPLPQANSQRAFGLFNPPRGTTRPSPMKLRRALYLRSGDIIPVEVAKINEDGVWFRSSFSEKGFVPNDRIKAVELAAEESPTVRVSKAKLDRLLTLPRMQKDSPPTHLIRSVNGDILRGRVVAMDDKALRVEVRLEEKSVPRDRVSRIIWLHADETDPSKKITPPPEAGRSTRVQAVRSDGTRLTFTAEAVSAGVLLGRSDVLGACEVRIGEVDQLLIGGAIETEATQLAYQNYKLHDAPEPRSAQADGSGSPNGGAAGTEAALVGKPAPDFQLNLLGGEKFHLADHKGKVIVLDFWATWCGPCLQAMPQIERVTREFADRGVELIAVNLQETPAQIKAMLERQKLSPLVALDRTGAVAEKYGATAIPQTVVIDREGKVTRLFVGGGPRLGDQLKEALQAALRPAQPQ